MNQSGNVLFHLPICKRVNSLSLLNLKVCLIEKALNKGNYNDNELAFLPNTQPYSM